MGNTINITLMRHGRSLADDERVHEGRYDSPLTDVGRAQVNSQAERWKHAGVGFDLIVASTLLRASESAQIVSDVLNIPVEHDPDWIEIDNGPLAGLPFSVGRERYPRPEFENPFQPYVVSTGEGESGWDLFTRGARALQRVVRRGLESTLVVAHGGTINAALYCMLGVPPPASTSSVRFLIGDACYVRTSYDPDRHVWTIREMSSWTEGNVPGQPH